MSSVGDLVAFLTVNQAGFQQGFAKAQATARTGAAGISAAIAPIAGALAPLTAALAAAFGASTSLSAAREDLKAMQKLEAVLKATGGTARMTASEIAAYASELQKVTNFGDEATVSAAAFIATFKNINGENFKRAIALAQDMATVMDVDLETAAKKLGKTLKDVAPEQVGEKLKELESRFSGAAAAVVDPWTQLKNVIGDVGEQVGYLLLPAVNALSEALTQTVGEGIPQFESLRQTVQEFVDGAVIAYGTLGESAYLFYLQSELAVVQTAGAVQHAFTEVMPEYVKWFFENWQQIAVDAVNFQLTVIQNLATNFQGIWQTVLDYIAGNPVEFDWKPLTEGFKSTVGELPQIQERVKSELENGLEDDIRTQQEQITRQQTEMSDKIIADRKAKQNAKGFTLGEIPPGKGAKEDTKVGALAKGSVEALSAVLGANGKDELQKAQLKAAEDAADAAERTADATEELAKGGGIVLMAGSIA